MPSNSFTATAALAALLALSSAAFAGPMNGTFTVHYDKQAPQPMGPDRVKIDETGSGLNKSPGQPLDNAQVTLSDTAMLTKGQGPMTGSITFSTPNGSVTSGLNGKVSTDAQGRVTTTGKFKVVQTTGAMSGIKGSGNFSTAFSSQSDQTTSWQGKFTDPKPSSASR